MIGGMPAPEPPRILVVEDDPGVAAQTVRGLRDAGLDVELAVDAKAARTQARRWRPDVVVLDLGLPDDDGLELIAWLRTGIGARVLVVTARTELRTRLDAFGHGADDYLAKPFFVEELIARIRSRLALPATVARRRIAWADVEVDLDARRVVVAGADVTLTRAELGLLLYLVERAGRAVTRDDLAAAVLDDDADRRTLDSHVARVRRKLGGAGAAIRTVWGIGYRFTPEEP